MPGDFFVFNRAPESANVGANGKGRGTGAPGRETATWAKRGGDVRKPKVNRPTAPESGHVGQMEKNG